MASQLYELAREKFLEGDIAWKSGGDNFKLYLIDETDYTVNFTTDEFADDIATGAKVATSGNLSSLTSTLGVADAADETFSSVTGDACDSIVIWKDSGVQATSPLLVYLDDPDVTGLPITPNGGDITVQWSGTADKIFVLGPTQV
jgi:hypothetical protein